MLWNRSLVMRDLETGSLWSHILGRCMRGELKDEELPFIPGTVTTWAEWQQKYPDTSVLNMSRKTGDYQRFVFTEPRNFVIGVKVGMSVKAYTFAYLLENPIVQEDLADTPILLAFEPETTRAFVFERSIDGKPLDFAASPREGKLVDRETNSHWDPWSGEAVAGQLQGAKLPPSYGIISFRKAWAQFYPGSEIVDLPPVEGRSFTRP